MATDCRCFSENEDKCFCDFEEEIHKLKMVLAAAQEELTYEKLSKTPIKKVAPVVRGWLQCTQCGNGHATTKENEEFDPEDGHACGFCGVGIMRVSYD